ncbi:metallophosphoesterase [Fredinandcohnia sp. QZ13]|uniref:metallophosphoesterase n=1 Tax=Fredinandcohnia sp. QZ13 TaxID=3073144 RepID=UPI00285347A8|nr:metallophosphoesterase [Fredinandcohnia sp. QZ13]MDR4888747.1 metallophosphoesterase [Fredinandcohnia sp. QZ13]
MIYFLGIIIVGMLLLLFMWQEARLERVVTKTLTFSDFPKSFKKLTIFFISDIHRREVSEKIINEVKGKADIVIIGGDLTEKGVPFERVKKNLQLINTVGPTYFVWGNNDYEVDYHELDSLLLSMGIKILDNTAMFFETEDGEKLALLGIDDLKVGRSRLDLALLDAGDEADFKILISHNPEIKNVLIPDNKINLLLSGHTHGGQIRFWKFGLYPKGGVEYKNGMTIFISNGYGTSGIPLRFGAPPETHLITLQSSDS